MRTTDNRRRSKRSADYYLIASMLLAAFLNMYLIWTDKYVNTYYTTAVASMMKNFHNFFYGTLDSGGFVTVDKPPLTFMIQTLFAFIFGLHGWSVILPQALSGVGSVLLIYLLVKPSFGTGAARIGALVMACTPVAVAVSRTNNIDSMLVFALLLAAWFLFKGVKQGKMWAVIVGFGLIGVGFNIKMLEAYMVLPAFYFFYIIAGIGGWKKKVTTLIASTVACAVISLSWAVIVDSTPADQRPYIGSSQTNSVLNLAFGYNGVSRLTGDRNTGGSGKSDGGGADFGSMKPGNGSSSSTDQAAPGGAPGSGPNGGGANANANAGAMFGNPGFGGERPTMNFGGGGGMFNTGTAGPLRLFQSELSGQASWMLPFVLFGCIALFANFRLRQMTWKHKEALFWLGWLIPVAGFFSMAGFFHQYYLIMLAPPVAALTGAGWAEMTKQWREGGWKAWLLPAAVLLTAGFSWYIVQPYDSVIGKGWSIAIAVTGVLAALWLIAGIFKQPLGKPAAILGFLILLIGPMYWALTPITYGQSSMTPAAGPDSVGGMGGSRGGGFAMAAPGGLDWPGGTNRDGANGRTGSSEDASANGSSTDNGSRSTAGAPAVPSQSTNSSGGGLGRGEGSSLDEGLYQYLKDNNTGEKYLFAAFDYTTLAPYIIEQGENVISLGGFSGSDPVLSVDRVQELINSGQLKYIYMSGRGGSSTLTQWIQDHGTEVPSSEWEGTSGQNQTADTGGRTGFGSSGTLYEFTPDQGE
ncbi:ArnT family glycosyltransferase [Paenibacillus pinistramenti]|uniref:ArnT family glycosyltransferase n=1 Tax=Paenibacillus pinistramenti TaxID=1768003 RepID=UPI0011080498|nr:glycosyltransferase family 39 protein [Paenibacillus pinistramenti]